MFWFSNMNCQWTSSLTGLDMNFLTWQQLCYNFVYMCKVLFNTTAISLINNILPVLGLFFRNSKTFFGNALFFSLKLCSIFKRLIYIYYFQTTSCLISKDELSFLSSWLSPAHFQSVGNFTNKNHFKRRLRVLIIKYSGKYCYFNR